MKKYLVLTSNDAAILLKCLSIGSDTISKEYHLIPFDLLSSETESIYLDQLDHIDGIVKRLKKTFYI